MPAVPSPYDPLGLPGFTFADLHQPRRLEALYLRFCEQTRGADPDLWSQWEQYREVPEALGVSASVLQVHDRLNIRTPRRTISYDLSAVPEWLAWRDAKNG